MNDIIKTLVDEGFEQVQVKASELLEGDRVVVGEVALYVEVHETTITLRDGNVSHTGRIFANNIINDWRCPVYRKKQQKPLVWEGYTWRSSCGAAVVTLPPEFDRQKVKVTLADSTPKSSPVWRGRVLSSISGGIYPIRGAWAAQDFNGKEIEIYLAGEKQ